MEDECGNVEDVFTNDEDIFDEYELISSPCRKTPNQTQSFLVMMTGDGNGNGDGDGDGDGDDDDDDEWEKRRKRLCVALVAHRSIKKKRMKAVETEG
jgi:hypothetical protein